jgi:hypothetical protein
MLESRLSVRSVLGFSCAALLGSTACGDVPGEASVPAPVGVDAQPETAVEECFTEDGPDYRSGVNTVFSKVWPSGIVPFSTAGLSATLEANVLEGIRHWEERTKLRFFPGATSGNRILFKVWSESGGWSHIGMQGGAQDIKLCATCGVGTVIHEIGHAIGFYHEQQRTDRDDFVTINWDCIKPGKEGNFDTYNSSGRNVGPYDLNSIMHYSSTNMLVEGVPSCTWTIRTKSGATIPSKSVLSPRDIAGANYLYQEWHTVRTAVDYNGDRKADIAVYRPSGGNFLISGEASPKWWKGVPVPGDYDGDLRGDVATWNSTTGGWKILKSSNGATMNATWGAVGDVPVPGDYDGDLKADPATWSPYSGDWKILLSTTGAGRAKFGFGAAGDIPAPGDYDADGKFDYAYYRPMTGTSTLGNWTIINSTNNTTWTRQYGRAGDVPVPADYDGDRKADTAVFRPSNGNWYVFQSTTNTDWVATWGQEGDIPAPGDYDNDGRAELAFFRPSTGTWSIVNVWTGAQTTKVFGKFGDVPIP